MRGLSLGDLEGLVGKVALVTGASSGIGRGVALSLAGLGVRTALVARRGLETVRSEIVRASGHAIAVPTDLRDPSAIERAVGAVQVEWGGIDFLINAAGIGREAPLMSGRSEDFAELLQVNVLAVAVATRLVIADLVRRGAAGHIVHISSLSGYRVQTGAGMYAATKHAVRAMTEGLRRELRRAQSPIRVTAISPGDTDTAFLENLYGDPARARAAKPVYPMLEVEDVVRAVLFALSLPPRAEVHDILLRPTAQPD